ncbi:MarR family transcriptional regulator [Fusobacterium varium]|uniref:MarR family transcriptional regulator n=1 Tax=Fusobacterium TaxID=848 RepID=UPI0015A4E529
MKNEAFGNSLYSYLSRAHHRSRIFMDEELRKKGITDLGYSHIRIIIVLYVFKTLSMKEITEKISKDKSTVTILVNKLEKKGYVRKSVCSEDRRVMYLELREKAEEVIGVIFDVSQIFHKKVEQILEKDEIDTLKRIMSKLLEKW